MAIVPSAKLGPARTRLPNGEFGLGVPGGIPARTDPAKIIDLTSAPYSFTPGGDITSALNAAIVAVAEDGVILMPPGSHTITNVSLPRADGALYTLNPKGNYTIRGAGGEETELIAQGTAGGFSAFYTPNFNGAVADVVSGLTADSTSVVVSTTDDMHVGKFGLFSLPNDPRYPIFSPFNTGNYLGTFSVMITGVNAGTSTVTFTPPLPDDFSDLESVTGLPVQFRGEPNYLPVIGVGFEGFSMREDETAEPWEKVHNHFNLGGMYKCWLKDVRYGGHTKHAFPLATSVQFEMRKYHVAASPSSGTNLSGFLPSGCSNLLVVDNCFEDNAPNVEFWSNNVSVGFVDNFMPRGTSGLNINVHNLHCRFLYIEGNVVPNIQVDTWFGPATQVTMFRNWFFGRHGTFASSVESFTTDVQRFVRDSVFAGNVVGIPGGGMANNGQYFGYPYAGWLVNGTASLGGADPWEDYDSVNNRTKSWPGVLTTRTSDSAGIITMDSSEIADSLDASLAHMHAAGGETGRRAANWTQTLYLGTRTGNSYPFTIAANPNPVEGAAVVIFPGVLGFRERDLDVPATMTVKANFNFFDGAIPAGEALGGGETLEDSVLYTAKPDHFGDEFDWPAIDPSNPPAAWDQATVENILPAAWRYYKGAGEPDPDPEPPEETPWPTTPRTNRSSRYGRTCLFP